MGKEKANSPSRTGSHANGTPLKKPPCSESAPQRGLLSSTVARLGFNLLSPPVPLTHTCRDTLVQTHTLSQHLLSPCSPTVAPRPPPKKYTLIISLAAGQIHHQHCHNHHCLYCCWESIFFSWKRCPLLRRPRKHMLCKKPLSSK